MPKIIRIIRPASRETDSPLEKNINYLEQNGFVVRYDDIKPDPEWHYTAGSVETRAQALTNALLEKDVDIIWAARGGYGCSDLLHLLPWPLLRSIARKRIIGFSDCSALLSAFYQKLGWRGIHAPMPGSHLWGKDGNYSDIDMLIQLIKQQSPDCELPLQHLTPHKSAQGWLFGGTLSVLSNLIGTPFFPTDLNGALVFLEDVSETPPRIIRMFNQWRHSGALKRVNGIILGHFKDCAKSDADTQKYIYEEIAKRSPVPVWQTNLFGHISPNYPLKIAAAAEIHEDRLVVSY